MTDNTTLNYGAGGDQVRNLDRQGAGVKTQVVALDLGGGSANAENLVSAGRQTAANSVPVVLASDQGTFPVDTTNLVQSVRDPFDTFSNGVGWTLSLAGNDIVALDGNAAGVSWLTFSLDPLAEGTTTSLTGTFTMSNPIEGSVGLSISQRVLGNEFAVEVVSTDAPLAPFVDAAISSIQQTATTLSVSTQNPHGLKAGDAISTYGVPDSRLNYPAIVVATVPSPSSFTVTAGPGGALTSINSSAFTQGFVAMRARLGRAQSGTSVIFENATATNASYYVRSGGGDVLPSGVVNGSHSVITLTTASVQVVNAPYTYAFSPTNEYRFSVMADKVQWSDGTVDATSQFVSRFTKTQTVPSDTKTYTLRIRASNDHATTRPVAKIVSVSKPGSPLATFTTDGPHGLTTSDYVIINGVSDQTNFTSYTIPQVVSSVINATHFTVSFGTSATATGYGGFVARAQGGNVPASFISQAAGSATLAAAADGTQALTLTGSAAWAGLLIGDSTNVHGLRDVAAGADLGCDGAWKVRNVSATTLELGPIGSTVPPANFGPTSCGGSIIKRTDLRLAFVRMVEFNRMRVELLPRPINDSANSAPVTVQSGSITTVAAVTAANLNLPTLVTDIASSAITTTTTTNAFTPTYGSSYEVFIPVTAANGTLDVQVQETEDGTNYFPVYDFPRITAVGAYRSPILPCKGHSVRYVQTFSGTTMTRSINRMQGSLTPSSIRRIFDRTITLTTLNSTTASLDVADCWNVQLSINIGAAATPPAIQLEGSDDNGASWFAIGSPLTGVASSTVTVTVNNVNAQLVRGRVSTIGVTVTAGYVQLKGF